MLTRQVIEVGHVFGTMGLTVLRELAR